MIRLINADELEGTGQVEVSLENLIENVKNSTPYPRQRGILKNWAFGLPYKIDKGFWCGRNIIVYNLIHIQNANLRKYPRVKFNCVCPFHYKNPSWISEHFIVFCATSNSNKTPCSSIRKKMLNKFLIMKTLLKSSLPIAFLISLWHFSSCSAGTNKEASSSGESAPVEKIQLVRDDANTKVDVLVDGELFTSYIYPSTIKKPVLYPLLTSRGTKITRGFPLEPTPGERVDHPHHVGLWFNYGDVNGLDFWNNSDSIAVKDRAKYGTIVHQEIVSMQNGNEKAILEVKMLWKTPTGEVLLTENTTFIFRAVDNERTIDRITTLVSNGSQIVFKDNKEGMIAIRVTRALEHPADKPEQFTDAAGKATAIPTLNNEGVNGLYLNSHGQTGGAVWGKRADWVNLTSTIGTEDISLAIFDHPGNVGYPTYWHARTYGLFAANPLGQSVFSEGVEVLNYTLDANASVTWKHRILIVSGAKLGKEVLDEKFKQFSAE